MKRPRAISRDPTAVPPVPGPSAEWCLLFTWIVSLGALVIGLATVGSTWAPAPELLDPDTWATWVSERGAFEAFAGLARLVVLALGVHLLISSLLVVVANLRPRGHCARIVGYVVLPAIQSGIRSMMGVGLIGMTTVGPALVATSRPMGAAVVAVSHAAEIRGSEQQAPHSPAPIMTRLDDPRVESVPPATSPPATSPPATSPPATSPPATSPPATSPPATSPPPTSPPPTSPPPTSPPLRHRGGSTVESGGEWMVRPGDHLWGIAEAVLVEAGASGAGVSEGDVARYWTALIQANRDRLVDPANPDLIFADQVLLLPPRAGSLR